MKENKIVGYILLSPALLSVLLFLIDLITPGTDVFSKLSSDWSGSFGENGGYSSALPIYFGLMAIAGVYLIKNSNTKE